MRPDRAGRARRAEGRNLAERAGRWSAAHWKTATFGWLAFIAVAVAIGQLAGTAKLTDSEQATGESARAEAALSASGLHRSASESVLVQSGHAVVDDPTFARTLDRVRAELRSLPQTRDVRAGAPGQLSRDRHSALVQFDMRGDPETAEDRVAPVLAKVAALQRSAPGFTIVEFGDASARHELRKTMNDDFSHAESLSLPITFLVLLLAFGAFVAAGVPVLLAFSAVLGSLGLAAALSHVLHASDATSSVMLLMGMAVGVDYSLFYLKREREERRGLPPHAALARAAATSGRAVLVSGTTVLIAMAGMLLAGSKVFGSIGAGAMLVVLVSMVGSLTVLPALLGKLGDRVDRGVLAVLAAMALRLLRPLGRVRVLRRLAQPRPLVWLRDRRTLIQAIKGRRESSRLWSLVLRPALRFPAVAVALSVAVLLAMAVPVLGMHTKLPSFTDLPAKVQIVQSYKKIQRAFPGAQTPAVVVVQAADVTRPPVRGAIARLEHEALASGQMKGPIALALNPAHTLAKVEIPLAGNGDDDRALAALATLRERLLPATIGQVPGATYAVTGQAAGTHDFNQTTKQHWPLVFAFVLGFAFLLLLVTFRSLAIPLTAIVLNLLSVGAAYGVLVWVFQDGHLQGLLDFHSNGAVVTWLPLFLFAVLFGLSMDYHVFIVSRIKELADEGVPTGEAVARGISSTAGTVTAAAAVMVAVFALFATLSTLEIKQMGVGLAVAVLIDATLIRGVLLPAGMKLLGRWNWYLPRWLRWLPQAGGARPEEPAGRRARPTRGEAAAATEAA
ncbi:MAG TPA: MMPL family transporter [Solirubrobacteraceae bacterium]|nr:MMPL family transporter [Solirubrobacteraceae bacterium]